MQSPATTFFMLNKNMTLKQLQTHLQSVCDERGWNDTNVTEKFLLFIEEVGELAKEIRAYKGIYTEIGKPKYSKERLELEFADVLNYLLDLANRAEIDLTGAYIKKHKINEKRKWKTCTKARSSSQK